MGNAFIVAHATQVNSWRDELNRYLQPWLRAVFDRSYHLDLEQPLYHFYVQRCVTQRGAL